MSIADTLRPNTSTPRTNASLLEEAPACVSAVAWDAVIAGAVGAAALSLILFFLGSGLGFGAASPWIGGMSATGWAVSAIAWITFTQLAASALGGYLTGRLRVRWAGAQPDEVYFRDTAHGFLSWSLATLLTATLMATAVGSVVSTGVQVGATTAATAVVAETGTEAIQGYDATEETAYLVDALFRKPASATSTTAVTPVSASTEPGSAETAQASNFEATRIFANAVRTQTLPPEDAAYLGQLVGQRSGLSQADAAKRVNDTFARLQNQINAAQATAAATAEKARKASSYAALWFCIALLAGAFVASLAATFGGRQRDA